MYTTLPVKKFSYKLAVSICVFIPLLLSACGGSNTANTSIAGTITGLHNPLVLQNNGGDNLTLTTEGSFAFSTKMAAGTQYAVTILKQPVNQTCTVSNGTGTAGNIVINIKINCSIFVISTTPTSEGTNIALNATISARFSGAIDPASITTKSFIVSGVPGSASLSEDKRSAIFTPTSPLASNTLYTVTIDKSVQDNNKNTLDSQLIWRFTTGTTLDSTSPQVSSTSPQHGDTNIPTNSTVLVSFSEAINPATLTNATFTLKQIINFPAISIIGETFVRPLISGTVVTSADNRSATFTPNTILPAGTSYTAALTSDVQDIAGNSLGGSSLTIYSWVFTVGNDTNMTAPVLLSVSPANNSLLQPVGTTFISATFDKSINCVTVSTNSLQVFDKGTPMNGYTECNGATLQFKPQAGVSLPSNASLTATLAPSIKDMTGNAISAYRWSFDMAP